MYPSLKNINWIKQQALNQTKIDSAVSEIGLPKGTVRGKIVDVDDPENLGRVRVLFDAFNAEDVPQVENSGRFSSSREGQGGNISHWIDTSPAFKGRQPPGLVGKRVNIAVSDGQYHYAILQDVLHDPQNLVSSVGEKLEIPNNSTMSRLPVYPAGKLPPPDETNIGCQVVEEGGPMNSDWLCICLRRNGKPIWVRHGDLQHAHAGGNDITSQVDSSGNRPSPGQVGTIWDFVIPTSGSELVKYSGYSTAPSGNPWANGAGWNPPPMDTETKPLPFKTGSLFDQRNALNVARNSGYIDQILKGFTTSYAPDISATVETVPGYNFAKEALAKAQKALSAAESLRKVINDPTKFVTDTALSALGSIAPASTNQVISALRNPQGTIDTVFSSIKVALGL